VAGRSAGRRLSFGRELIEQLGRAEVNLGRLIGRVADCRYTYAAPLFERAGMW
jgi:hypothetical protein